MNDQPKQDPKQQDVPLGQPSEAPAKIEPTPERARQEKEKREKTAEQKR